MNRTWPLPFQNAGLISHDFRSTIVNWDNVMIIQTNSDFGNRG
jgi:hypothetical protein